MRAAARPLPAQFKEPPSSGHYDMSATTPKKTPKAGKGPTKIFIVDDHPMMREGLGQLIGQEPDLTVCGEAESAPEAVERITVLKPDLAIVDISLRTGNGLELIKDVQARNPTVAVLVI